MFSGLLPSYINTPCFAVQLLKRPVKLIAMFTSLRLLTRTGRRVMLAAVVCSGLAACADSIVLEPPQPFTESQVSPQRPEPSPTPEPETPGEHVQYRLNQAGEFAQSRRGLVWPLLLVIAVLWGFVKLLKWIYELTTSSPVV
jgi:hypothetical protein